MKPELKRLYSMKKIEERAYAQKVNRGTLRVTFLPSTNYLTSLRLIIASKATSSVNRNYRLLLKRAQSC